jgi:hypothetical protein
VSGFVAICSFDSKRGEFVSECLPIEDVDGIEIGGELWKDEVLHSCGRCDVALEDEGVLPDFCDSEPVCDLETFGCEKTGKDGKVEAEICYVDKKDSLKTACVDPYDLDLKAEEEFFDSCGGC